MELVLNEDQELIAKTALDFVEEHSPVSPLPGAARRRTMKLGYSREAVQSRWRSWAGLGIPFDEKVGWRRNGALPKWF